MPKNRIALTCDHHGYALKEIIKKWLIEEKNAEIVLDTNPGPDNIDAVSGTEQTRRICEAIQRDECRHGIMICGTGTGFCQLANMYWGIRAANVSECFTAERSRKSQNSHLLCIGTWILSPEYAKKVISAWYDEPFDWGRESSVKNLKLFEEFNNELTPKPDHVAWSMGYSPDDQGEWYYPAK